MSSSLLNTARFYLKRFTWKNLKKQTKKKQLILFPTLSPPPHPQQNQTAVFWALPKNRMPDFTSFHLNIVFNNWKEVQKKDTWDTHTRSGLLS